MTNPSNSGDQEVPPPLVKLPHPTSIAELLTEEEFKQLAFHMKNLGDPHDFAMGFLAKDGEVLIRKSRTRSYASAVDSTWRSIVEPGGRPFTAIPYSAGDDGSSTWCCFDIDDHHGRDVSHVHWLVKKLLDGIGRLTEAPGRNLAVLIEHSGRGWHFFIISSGPRPLCEWLKLIGEVTIKSGLKGEKGIEHFPVQSGKHSGVRLPGSANPKTWNPADGTYKVSMILATAELKELLSRLPPSVEQAEMIAGSTFNQKGTPVWLKRGKEKGAKPDRPLPWQDLKDAKRVLNSYAVTAPSTRHSQLLRLVADGIQHFAKRVLREIATAQYHQGGTNCASDLDTHLAEFEDIYQWKMEQIIASFSDRERQVLASIGGDDYRSAFLITRNFATYRPKRPSGWKRGQFPLSGLDLAQRQQTGVGTAYNHRRAMVELGCIRKVADYIKGVKADEFVWLLGPVQKAADPPMPSRSGAVTAGDSPAATASVPAAPGAAGRTTKGGRGRGR